MARPNIPDTARKNIRTVRDLEAAFAGRRTLAERLTDRATAFVGTFWFLAAEALAIGAWIAANAARGTLGFDPYPFELLNFLVGVQAIVLSTVVLMSQNRQTRQAEHWGHLQLQVSLLAEQETTKMLELLRGLCRNAGLSAAAADPELDQMIRTTHVAGLANELEKVRDETGEAGAPPAGGA